MPEPTRLLGLKTRLLVHARVSEAEPVAELCGLESIGAVFLTASISEGQSALTKIRRTSAAAPVLFDANRYSGKNRKSARAGIDPLWVAAQLRVGAACALTDSGYVADGDLGGLRRILRATSKLKGNVVAVLPLAGYWWDDGPRQALVHEVGKYGVPVGLILEHSDDPFSAIRTVQGVVSFLAEVSVPVILLRSDLSGLGVLAFGGAAAAIGTSSSLRHLYPLHKGGGGGRPAQISVLWPKGLAYRSVDKITDAIAADPDHTHWLCECSICYGRSLEWILDSDDQHTNAYRHSVAAIRRLADDLDGSSLTTQELQTTWLETCRVAQGYSYEVAGISGKSWEPPKALGAWNRAMPARVG